MTRWIVGLLDAQIAAARARGDFEDLPGRGQPLVLDDLEGLTGEQRFEALLLRSVGEVAPEVALIRGLRARRQRMVDADSAPARAVLEGEQRAQLVELIAALEARRRG
ncbi:MAG: DnaJ family domain-containing protein [Polyangiales bacterium]